MAIHLVGDSHTWVYRGIMEGVVAHHIGPVTMHRVGRDKLEVVNIEKIGVNTGDTVIYVFGEIDVRCHIGKQIGLQGDREKVIGDLARNYLDTVCLNHSLMPNIKSIIRFITPPKSHIDNPSFPQDGTIEERVAITNEINLYLKDITVAPILFLDGDDFLGKVVSENGELSNEFSDDTVHFGTNARLFIKDNLLKVLGETDAIRL